jgi:PPP family 3-phenylpropionic acid transporter
MLVRLAAGPLVGMLADLLGSLRLVLATCAALAAGTAAAFMWANTVWSLFFIALIQAGALAPTTSIADALSVNAAKPQIAGRAFEYGWIRGSASAAFVMGTLIIGQLISDYDLTLIIWMNAALLVMAAGATALVPRVTTRPGPHASGSPVLAELHGLLGISRFRVLIIVSALVYGSHAMHDAFAVIRWSDAGMDTSVISVLWSEAVAAEVFVFFLIGPALIDRFGARGAAVLAAAAGIIRWSIEGVTTSVLLLSILQPPMIYRWPAAALGQLGRTTEAKEVLEKAVSRAPGAFDMYVRKRAPWFRPEDHAHLVEGLRKAGWNG